MARAGGQAVRIMNRALEPFGLRSRHYTVLTSSAEHGGLSQRDLGDVLGVDPSAVVALVDDLERAGLVCRDPHPGDRRARMVVLTAEGKRFLHRASVLARRVNAELLGALSADERRTLEGLLTKVVGVRPPGVGAQSR